MDEIEQAEADLAFALAQADGLAEDEAAARLARLIAERESETSGSPTTLPLLQA